MQDSLGIQVLGVQVDLIVVGIFMKHMLDKSTRLKSDACKYSVFYIEMFLF